MRVISAYDYSKQKWETGETARLLLVSYNNDQLDLLQGDRGVAYAKFLNSDRNKLIANCQAEAIRLAERN